MLLLVVGGHACAAQSPAVGIFDTGDSPAAPLAGDAMAKKAGWTLLHENQTQHEFKGDAVLANHRLTVVFRCP